MTSTTMTTIGIFENDQAARQAISALRDNGFTDDQFGIASREFAKQFDEVDVDAQNTAEDGAVKGAVIGGGIGATLGLVGGLLVPGILPLVAGQALVSVLLGGATGAAGGAVAGPFIAMGLSDAEADQHVKHVEAGKTVVIVYAPDRLDEAKQIMVDNGAYDDSMTSSP